VNEKKRENIILDGATPRNKIPEKRKENVLDMRADHAR
jgi:hypothetical protein